MIDDAEDGAVDERNRVVPDGRERETALRLMRSALALLDRVAETRGAASLQHAIDVVQRTPPGAPDPTEVEAILGPSCID